MHFLLPFFPPFSLVPSLHPLRHLIASWC
jgi:hypothetical protein